MESSELTPKMIEDMENVLGFELTKEIIDDHNWAYTELQKESSKRDKEARAQLRPDARIVLTERGEFELNRNAAPLIKLLRQGRADPDLQTWIADMIEASMKKGHGGFASRKSVLDRVRDMGPLYDAVTDLEGVELILRRRSGKRMKKRAAEIVAFHYRVSLEQVLGYEKRGTKARQRLPKFE